MIDVTGVTNLSNPRTLEVNKLTTLNKILIQNVSFYFNFIY